VPLDYAHPKRRMIDLALLRTRATDPARRLGSLLVNPGGPGVSGLDLPIDLRDAALRAGGSDAEVFARYDVVGFDPRGVAESTGVRCGDDVDAFYAQDATPDDTADRRALIEDMRTFARACASNSGRFLPFMGTRNAARDLDAIRKALGDQRLQFLGYSYGTQLGTAFAEEFPRFVGRLVLDGAIDPKLSGVELAQQQARSLEESFQRFAESCAGDAACAFNSDGDPAGAFDRLIAQLDAAPLQAGNGRTVTASQAVTGVANALFVRARWPAIANALAAASRGDGSGLIGLFDDYAQRSSDGTYSNLAAANLVVNCADYRWPRGTKGYDALVTKIRDQSPRFGQAFVWEFLPCAYWPVPTRPKPAPKAKDLPPILVVGTTGDPSTPYKWSQSLAGALPGSVLLTRDGEGHTAYLGGNQCIDDAVNNYLLTGATPPGGTTC
jgi:pimeloyl-ACP methyl ester carboxylesterase